MIWVGGGIIVHGLETFGWDSIAHFIHAAGVVVSGLVPFAKGFSAWLVEAAFSGVVGIIIGALTIPAMSYVVSPLWRAVRAALPARRVRS
jgi:predicted DNA repair protein MutK